jgi:hypothetical protein
MASVEKANIIEKYKHEGLVDAAARLCSEAELYSSNQQVDLAK